MQSIHKRSSINSGLKNTPPIHFILSKEQSTAHSKFLSICPLSKNKTIDLALFLPHPYIFHKLIIQISSIQKVCMIYKKL